LYFLLLIAVQSSMSAVANRRKSEFLVKVKMSIFQKKNLYRSVLSLSHRLETDLYNFFFVKILGGVEEKIMLPKKGFRGF
jgi:hypothetical protein